MTDETSSPYLDEATAEHSNDELVDAALDAVVAKEMDIPEVGGLEGFVQFIRTNDNEAETRRHVILFERGLVKEILNRVAAILEGDEAAMDENDRIIANYIEGK
jgi:hypothetical protein